MEGGYLGEFEHLVLLALLRLGDDAYGMTVWQELQKQSKRHVSLTAVYTTLGRMEVKGYVSSRLGRGSEERGGRRRKYFRLQPAGARALRAAHRLLLQLSSGLERELGIA